MGLKSGVAMSSWKKCTSRSKPGKFYYFNVVTKESRWKLPDDVKKMSGESRTSAEGDTKNQNQSLVTGSDGPGMGKHDFEQECGVSDRWNGTPDTGNEVQDTGDGYPHSGGDLGGGGPDTECDVHNTGDGNPPNSGEDSGPAAGSGDPDTERNDAPDTITETSDARKVSCAPAKHHSSTDDLASSSDVSITTRQLAALYARSLSMDSGAAVLLHQEEKTAQPEPSSVVDSGEATMDSQITEDFELFLLTEIVTMRDKFDVLPHFQHLPFPLTASINPNNRLYVVVDTSILLTHLALLTKYRDDAIDGVGSPVFVIPWVVLQELDRLYEHVDKRISTIVENTVRFFTDAIVSNHPRIVFQTYDEVCSAQSSGDNHDIIRCCRSFFRRIAEHEGLLILFTDDVQLSSLATSCRVRSLNRKTFFSELTSICKLAEAVAQVKKSTGAANKTSHMYLMEGFVCEYENVFCSALSAVVSNEMKLAFGSPLWLSIVMVKPPWTLTNIINVIDKHWVAAFGLVVETSLRTTCVEKLVKYIHSKSRWSSLQPGVRSRIVSSFIGHSRELLSAFGKIGSYKSVLDNSIAYLDEIALRIRKFESGRPATIPSTQAQFKVKIDTQRKVSISPEEEILQLVKSPPAETTEKLPWLLNVIGKTVRYCVAEVRAHLPRVGSAEVYIDLIERVITTTRRLSENERTISSLRGFVVAVDALLQKCFGVECPIDVNSLYAMVSEHQQTHLLAAALKDYTINCKLLRHLII